jgi:hypothetical protein
VTGAGLTRGVLVTWAAGCAAVYGLLFGLGKPVLGEPAAAAGLLLVAAAGGAVVARELRRP